MADGKTCAGPVCSCQVAAGKQYFSTTCEKATGSGSGPCPCGHPDCKGSQSGAF